MKKIKSLLLILIISLCLTNYAYAEDIDYKSLRNYKSMRDVIEIIERDYPFKLEEDQLYIGAMKGMLQSIDDYSDYYTIEETKEFLDDTDGKFTGIGIYIKSIKNTGYLDIESIIPNTPAEKAGLKKGDIIIKVDGKDLKDMKFFESSKIVRGSPNTIVKITYKRDEKTYEKKIKRQEIIINPVSIDKFGDIGYLRLSQFTIDASLRVKEALDKFEKENIKKIIFDLRGNPGGLFDEAVEVSKLFVPKAEIVSVKTIKGIVETHTSKTEKINFKYVVLVDEGSASSSEIVAGAIKDNKSGVIVGQKTFGKGLIQRFMPMHNGTSIKYTYAEYLTPSGKSINNKGITPDVVVENTEEKDLQLEKAKELLK